jgi:hypothetical protein
MWTGRQTLESIERTLTSLRQEEGELDGSLRSAIAEAERLRRERAESLRALARVKLDEMAAGRLTVNFDAGERRAAQVLEDYRLRLAGVEKRRTALQAEINQAEAERKSASETMEQALAAVERARSEAHGKVKDLPAWQAAKAAVDEADAIASEAEKKAAASEAEQAVKRKPYDDDALFSYLWQRRFGTSAYSAGNLARTIDRAMAAFIGYLDARPNYAALIEIPLRLREHATAKREEANARVAALADVERRAMTDAGVDALERALAEARHKHASADKTVEDKHGIMRKLDEEHTGLAATGRDAAYRDALDAIATADTQDEVSVLYREARRTPTDADDAIVGRIEATDKGIKRADDEIADLRRTARDLANRRTDVERTRERFRKAGYDHPNATFGNDGDIAEMLKGVLGGAAGSLLWDLLRAGYNYRPPRSPPDFGGSTFPFPLPRTGRSDPGERWREPSSRGTWSWDRHGGRDWADSGGGGGSRSDDRFTTDESV